MSRYKVSPEGSLQIFNARSEDSGLFTCILSNAGGSDSASAYLSVPGRWICMGCTNAYALMNGYGISVHDRCIDTLCTTTMYAGVK